MATVLTCKTEGTTNSRVTVAEGNAVVTTTAQLAATCSGTVSTSFISSFASTVANELGVSTDDIVVRDVVCESGHSFFNPGAQVQAASSFIDFGEAAAI